MAPHGYNTWKSRWIAVAIGAVALLATPVWLVRAGDVNQDGCVDLADHAAMQTAFTGPACTKRVIHSFYVSGSGELEVIPTVPGETGFVITDIDLTFFNGGGTVALAEGTGKPVRTLTILREQTLNLRSGIPVAAGATVTASGIAFGILISGYSF